MSNITHEEARKNFDELQEVILITFDLDEFLNECDLVKDYITQQEVKEERAKKVDILLHKNLELLGLYQKLYEYEETYFSLDDNFIDEDKIAMKKQIKQLEEELK